MHPLLAAGSPQKFRLANTYYDTPDFALRERGIAFASAPGCNANSVAEYVVAALLCLSRRQGRPRAGSARRPGVAAQRPDPLQGRIDRFDRRLPG